MKEIKFRGFCLHRDDWFYGYFYTFGEKAYIILSGKPGIPEDHVEVVPESVGQYTGFEDFKNESIFAGDILRYTKKWKIGSGKNKGKEKFEYHYWVVFMSETGKWSARRGDVVQSLYSCISNHEVVGNIHSNPELLK